MDLVYLYFINYSCVPDNTFWISIFFSRVICVRRVWTQITFTLIWGATYLQKGVRDSNSLLPFWPQRIFTKTMNTMVLSIHLKSCNTYTLFLSMICNFILLVCVDIISVDTLWWILRVNTVKKVVTIRWLF